MRMGERVHGCSGWVSVYVRTFVNESGVWCVYCTYCRWLVHLRGVFVQHITTGLFELCSLSGCTLYL